MVDAAIFEVRAGVKSLIFRRPLLERLLLTCQRIGVRRFFIVEPDHSVAAGALGSFDGSPAATIIDSVAATRALMPADSSCMLLRGNIVARVSQLWDMFERWSAFPESIVASQSANDSLAGIIAVGRLDQRRLSENCHLRSTEALATSLKPRLDARNLRFESVAKDAPMPRWLDRRL